LTALQRIDAGHYSYYSGGMILAVFQTTVSGQKRGLLMKKLFGLFTALFLAISFATTASASTMYPATQTGHDVSFPNSSTPTAGTFGIIGVTGGRAFSYNTNFASEYQWASSYSPTVAPSVFINLNAPIGTTASNGMIGPDGSCSRKDKVCQAYNYGYNAAQDAYGHFGSSSTASIWWLDIETSNSWSSNASLNRNTIDGAAAFFEGGKVPNGSTVTGKGKPVGIYSTPSMWSTITNKYQNGLPAWVATTETTPAGAATHCTPNDFTNGITYLVQYNDGSGFDADFACP
jgi:hypothetical protein